MADTGTQQVVLWIGAVLALLAAVYPLAKRRSSAPGVGQYLLLAAGVAAAVAAGATLAALEIGSLAVSTGGGGAETATVHLGLAVGWALATAVTIVLLARLAAVGGGLLWGTIALDVAAVAAGAGAAALDAELGGLDAETASLALWGASAVLTLAVIVVVLRPLSGRASGLRSPGAALFSMLRNVLAGGLLLGLVVGLVGTGVLGVLPPLGTAAAWLVVQVPLAAGAVGIAFGQRATLADVEEGRG